MIICELFWEKKDWDATNLSEQAEKKTIYPNDQTLPVGTIWHLVNRILLLQRPGVARQVEIVQYLALHQSLSVAAEIMRSSRQVKYRLYQAMHQAVPGVTGK